MYNQRVFRLHRQALIAAIISAVFPMVSHAATAGRVEFAIGNVTASGTDGRERVLAKGGEINTGDTIQTTDGRIQIKFTDGGYMSLEPNTQFKVVDYAFEGKADGYEKGFFKLVKGGLRAITGAIGYTNKTAYRINTPVAIIGIRGTEFDGKYKEEGDNKKLVVHVIHGSVFLENGGGDLILFQGQSGVVTDENQEPEYTDEESMVAAAGPDGGKPQENEEEQQEQAELADVFVAAEQYDNAGVSNSLGTTSLLNVIAGYAAANARGIYTLDTNGSITGIPNYGQGGNGVPASFYSANFTSGTLTADFGNYSLVAALNILVTVHPQNSLPSSSTGTFSATGYISNSSADFRLPGTGSIGSLCFLNSCYFNATGLFSGPTAQNASINYEINNLNSPGCTPPCGSILGTAGFHASTVPAP